jgi:hypothetical protein
MYANYIDRKNREAQQKYLFVKDEDSGGTGMECFISVCKCIVLLHAELRIKFEGNKRVFLSYQKVEH